MSENPVPVEAKPAATILLLRDEPVFQVLMVRRHHEIEFATGALVFPGGKSHGDDHDPRWAEHVTGWDSFEAEDRALRIAAVREVFEESGLLLANDRDGAPLACGAFDLALRQSVDRGETAFLDVVREAGAVLDLDALATFARWITPATVSKRFDTRFYVAKAPADQLAVCDGREAVDAEWIAPSEALRLGRLGERKVIFPTKMNLGLLAQASSAAEAVRLARARPLVTVEPRVEQRPGGRTLVLPPEAGYGPVEELLSRALAGG